MARLVVIGGNAGGMSAAAQARRRNPKLEIVAIEKGTHTSYSACGIPYVVGGVVDDLEELVVRTPQEFRDDAASTSAWSTRWCRSTSTPAWSRSSTVDAAASRRWVSTS